VDSLLKSKKSIQYWRSAATAWSGVRIQRK